MPNNDGTFSDAEVFGAPNAEMTDEQVFGTAPVNSFASSKAGRALHGVMDPVYGIDQAVPHAISYATSLGGIYPNKVSDFYAGDAAKMDSAVNQRDQEYDSAKKAANFQGTDWMRILGNMASPANEVVAGGASQLTEASTLLGKALQGAAVGGAYGATAPTETSSDQSFLSGKMKQIGSGVALGAAAPVAGEAVASAVKPNISENAQALLDEGVRLTPGQIMGGTPQRVEDALTSVPIMGEAIMSAKRRGVEDMNRAVANRALDPIGEKLPESVNVGHDMVSYVKGKLSDAYDALLPTLTAKVDPQFNDEIEKLSGMAQTLPPQQAKRFEDILNQVMNKISKNGSITGESLKEMESALGQQAKGYKSDPNFDNRNLGQAFSSVQDSLRSMLTRSNPEQADTLRGINEGYANYARLRSAAASTGAGKNEGIFTPAQLAASVRNADKSMGKGQFAQGKALLQDLSGAANSTLPSTVPDSGSIGRALAGGLVLGHFSPAAVVKAAVAASLYTRPGIALMEALLAKRPEAAEPIANIVRKITSPVELSRALL